MDKSNVLYLVTTTYNADSFGILQPTTQERKVYCNVESITQREFYEAGRSGLNPEYKFTMFSYDYAGEDLLKFDNVYYTVYRTYKTNGDDIELYVQRRHGNG